MTGCPVTPVSRKPRPKSRKGSAAPKAVKPKLAKPEAVRISMLSASFRRYRLDGKWFLEVTMPAWPARTFGPVANSKILDRVQADVTSAMMRAASLALVSAGREWSA